jgi:hypothetical protein
MPAQTGTLTRRVSFIEISTGPTLASWVRWVKLNPP